MVSLTIAVTCTLLSPRWPMLDADCCHVTVVSLQADGTADVTTQVTADVTTCIKAYVTHQELLAAHSHSELLSCIISALSALI